MRLDYRKTLCLNSFVQRVLGRSCKNLLKTTKQHQPSLSRTPFLQLNLIHKAWQPIRALYLPYSPKPLEIPKAEDK